MSRYFTLGPIFQLGIAIAFLYGLDRFVAAFRIPWQEESRDEDTEDQQERYAARGQRMRYQVITIHTPQEVLDRAMRDFGPQGAGLHVTSQNQLGVVFQGGGGYVAVMVQPGAEETVVELETREWDFPVQQFMAQIHRRRRWWQRWRWWSRRPSGGTPRAPSPFHILDNDR